MRPTIAAYHVQPLPLVQASADTRGVVEVINQLVPTELGLDPGPIVRGMLLDTLRGRSPWQRLEECFADQDTARLVGQALAPDALHDDTVGRIRDRLDDVGPMKMLTAGAGRAEQAQGLEQQSVHFDTTSSSGQGAQLPPAGQLDPQAPAVPLTMPQGYSQDTRPALPPFVCATRGVARAVPLWGKPEDGQASDKPMHNALLSPIATFLGPHGVAPGADIQVADAALVTDDHLAALGDTLFITRFPATYHECGRRIVEAVAHHAWEAVGGLAHPKPTTHRPASAYQVAEGEVTRYGTASRAVVVHSSAPDQRRPQRLARALQASYRTLQATVRTAAPQASVCRADADAAAAPRRAHALPSGGRPGGGTARGWPGPAEFPSAAPHQRHP